ncbi:hypothetical protein BDY21DRAFT_337075 [Lineolata rhizophorae]|uniref:mRNA export factor MEX67 n=1 Tax=Lineolata rhizophorae TaxID=578093 RepID=A0A6A6P857_9PEZI|nr:hypothetical protein BDY21DRAFT_337075 [Lineolata rhizophorae]
MSPRLPARRATNQSSQRGTAKRRTGAVRTDRDGDLVMDGAPRGITKSRARGGAGRDNGKAGAKHHPSASLKKEILRHIGPTNSTSRAPGPETNKSSKHFKITGWKKSKAATNADGGVAALIAFLEKRATISSQKYANAHADKRKHEVKISKSRVQGDAFFISVRADEAPSVSRVNGYAFAGANIAVEEVAQFPGDDLPMDEQISANTSGSIRELLKNFLERRYDRNAKLLNLSNLEQDPELTSLGMFNTASTQSKFFPALMKICDDVFTSADEKREFVQSVTLSGNHLSSIAPVSTLAPTFPDLKNLDLSTNNFTSIRGLQGWRHKFKYLDHLVVAPNPFTENAVELQNELMKWYPRLRFFNRSQVRTDEDVAKLVSPTPMNSLLVAGPKFQDEQQIAENFIKNFIFGFDSDRNALIDLYYDEDCSFSYSVNTQSLNDPSTTQRHTKGEWDAWLKGSRNFIKVTTEQGRKVRLFRGLGAIRGAFNSLPMTQHPSLATDPQKWLIECVSQSGVPDPTGQFPGGVGGFLITLQGEFQEVSRSSGQTEKVRSFERTIVLGPGQESGRLRAVSDMLLVRAYGGFAAWLPETGGGPEVIVAELSRMSGMTLEFSKQCLDENEFNLEKAYAAFLNAKASLPQAAFL